MARLVIMKGLPASGKSTKAKEIMEQSGNAVRVNRDLLRKMFHFDKWSPRNEGRTIDAEKALVKYYLTQTNLKVIIDDTNLSPKQMSIWVNMAQTLNIEHEVVEMNTPVWECLQRDIGRPESVGHCVILNMAMRYKIWRPQEKIVIVDMDGTLADITHRLHFVKNVEKKDWKGFFDGISEDKPRPMVMMRVNELREQGYKIIVVSARPETYRQQTLDWLYLHNVPFLTLIMRGVGDHRPDDEVKQDILNTYFDKENIHLVIDDRPRVIRMWQANGLQVEDVGSGVEF
jgi:predicted kinase